MKKKLMSLIVILFTLLSSTNIYAEEVSYNVTIRFVNDLDEEIKKPETLSYLEGESVEINLDNYILDNFELNYLDHSLSIRNENNTLILDSISQNEEIIIHYFRLASYRVNHYRSETEGIFLDKSVDLVGRVGDTVPKQEDFDIPYGYKLIRNDIADILPDGSTQVNLYYAMDYYLVSFDLNGGYDGPNDIYELYGYKIEDLKSPKKDGYRFIGWFLEPKCINLVDADNLYVKTSTTYYAGYELINEDAKVVIEYYAENPNDERFSYLSSKEIFLPVGFEFELDPSYTDEVVHKHDISCYAIDPNPTSPSDFELNGFRRLNENLEDGYVYLMVDPGLSKSEYYYYKFNGEFYKTDKYHVSYQIGDALRIRRSSFEFEDIFMLFKPAFTCGSEYEFLSSDKIVVKEADNLLKVYLKRSIYTLSFGNSDTYPNSHYGYIEAKWGQFIYTEFDAINKTIGDDLGWSVVNQRNAEALKLLISMPKENNNYYRKRKTDGTKRINYFIKVDDEYTRIYSTDWSIFATQITDSDFIEIDGYEVNRDLSIKSGDYLSLDDDKNNIYYDPVKYNLVLISYPDVYKTYSITFSTSLAEAASYIPEPKHSYESFGGWYLNEDLSGEPVDLNSKLMPSYNLSLYAKWNKEKYTIRFKDSRTSLDEEIELEYGSTISSPPIIDDPLFIGWLKEGTVDEIVSLNNYRVISNLNLVALYSEDEFINYSINYIDESGNKVANSSRGSIIKGNSITVYPKSSSELYLMYRGEYKPVENEYEFLVTDDKNSFDIIYVPYTKYFITINPSGLLDNESIILSINGKGFNNLEVVISETITIYGFYELENYTLEFNNGYSYTYNSIDPINYYADEDRVIPLTLSKRTSKFYETETHRLNIFN